MCKWGIFQCQVCSRTGTVRKILAAQIQVNENLTPPAKFMIATVKQPEITFDYLIFCGGIFKLLVDDGIFSYSIFPGHAGSPLFGQSG